METKTQEYVRIGCFRIPTSHFKPPDEQKLLELAEDMARLVTGHPLRSQTLLSPQDLFAKPNILFAGHRK